MKSFWRDDGLLIRRDHGFSVKREDLPWPRCKMSSLVFFLHQSFVVSSVYNRTSCKRFYLFPEWLYHSPSGRGGYLLMLEWDVCTEVPSYSVPIVILRGTAKMLQNAQECGFTD